MTAREDRHSRTICQGTLAFAYRRDPIRSSLNSDTDRSGRTTVAKSEQRLAVPGHGPDEPTPRAHAAPSRTATRSRPIKRLPDLLGEEVDEDPRIAVGLTALSSTFATSGQSVARKAPNRLTQAPRPTAATGLELGRRRRLQTTAHPAYRNKFRSTARHGGRLGLGRIREVWATIEPFPGTGTMSALAKTRDSRPGERRTSRAARRTS
jgi:hypothetical protein